jgi:hypothetical protein
MNAVTSIWRELMRRRLWPVAVLLVAALAAVPVLLTRDAQPVAAPADPAPAVSAKADDTIAEPVIAKVQASDRDRRRRVLGARKDPFQPPPVKKPKKAKKADAKADDTPTDTTGGGSSGGGGGGATAPTGPVAVAPKPKVYPADSLVIRFGDAASDQLPKTVLRKLKPLPDDETALIVYMGLTDHGKKAKFLVDDSLQVTGDGTCKPHPSNCETIELAVGETEFFDVIDPETGDIVSSFELDLIKINHKS